MRKLQGVSLKKIIRILLGAVFMLSSIAKLSSMESFELYIFSFGYLDFDITSLVARAIVICEFLIGAGMASGVMFRMSRNLTAAFLLFFSAFLVWRMVAGDTGSCHCMGQLVDMNPTESLLKNIVLAIMLAYVWNQPPRTFRYGKIAAAAVSCVASCAVFMVSPPDMYYRIGRTSSDLVAEEFMPVADSLGLDKGRRIVCFYSGTCEHCRHSAAKMAGIIRRHDIPDDSVNVIFMQTHANQDSVATSFFNIHGEGKHLPYAHLHPYVFLPMTNGSMPLIILMDDGEIVKEYDYLSIDEGEIADFFGN